MKNNCFLSYFIWKLIFYLPLAWFFFSKSNTAVVWWFLLLLFASEFSIWSFVAEEMGSYRSGQLCWGIFRAVNWRYALVVYTYSFHFWISILHIQMLFHFTLSFPELSWMLSLGFPIPVPRLTFTVVFLWFNMNYCSIKKAEGEPAEC